MLGYTITASDLSVSVCGGSKSSPLVLSANPYSITTKKPIGFMAVSGDVYNTMPEGLPVLMVYKDGGVEITEDYNMLDVADARFVVAGSAMLIRNREKCEIGSTLNIRPQTAMPRMGVGHLMTGELMFLVLEGGTAEDLQRAFSFYRVYDAMMLSYSDIYVQDNIGGITMGTQPITVLEAKKFKSLIHPIIVIDIGHGGADPGAIGLGKKEKDVNLKMGMAMRDFLVRNYEGTFLVTRSDDSTLSLKERTDMAKAVGADFVISMHCNAFNTPQAHGYESWIFTTPRGNSADVRNAVHDEVMAFLAPYGITDRGRKKGNLHMVREPINSMLVENLFITNPGNNKLLSDVNFLMKLSEVTAKGLAKGLKLKTKLTTVPSEAVPTAGWALQTGFYTYKKGALDEQARLKTLGINTILVPKTVAIVKK